MTRRLVAGYLALAAAVLLALELPLAIIYRRNEAQSVQARIEREAVALASFSEDTMEADLPRVQRQRVNANTRLVRLVTRYSAEANARAVLVAKDGTVLIDTDTKLPIGRNFTSRPEIARALKGEPNSGERRSATLGTTLVYAAVPVASGGVVHGAVRVSFAARVLDERVRRIVIVEDNLEAARLLFNDIPLNSGVLAPVRIVLPECLLNPPAHEDPAQCAAIVGGNVETSQRVVDVLLGSLRLAAGSQGTMNNVTFGERPPRSPNSLHSEQVPQGSPS